MASSAVLRRISRCAQLNRMMSTATNRARPLLMLPPAVDGRGNVAYTFHQPATKQYMVHKRKKIDEIQIIPPDIAIDDVKFAGSSHGWIAFSQWSNSGHLCLSNPITERHIRLPPPPPTTAPERVILSSPASDEECMAFMIFDSAGRGWGRLAFCRPSQTGTEWTRMGVLDYVDYENILYSTTHKRLLCICHKRYPKNIVIECWDVVSDDNNNNNNNNAPTLDWVIDDNCELNRRYSPEFPTMHELKRKCVQMSYLVCAEDSGELFLVVRHVNPRAAPYGEGFCVVDQVKDYNYTDEVDDDEDAGISGIPYKTIDFDVYKIDTVTGEVMYMENGLQGLAMFVGMSDPVAIPAAEAAGLKPDSIYFTDENRFVEATRLEATTYGGHDNGIFDYRNKDFSAFCDFYPVEQHKIRKILPLPLWFRP